MPYFIKQCTLEVNLTISRYDQTRRNATLRDEKAMLRAENRAKFRRAPPQKYAAGSIPVLQYGYLITFTVLVKCIEYFCT